MKWYEFQINENKYQYHLYQYHMKIAIDGSLVHDIYHGVGGGGGGLR